ncbi:Protein phosphatase 2C family protein [Arabidopsis thaliana]|uniref:Protein phosphatase 2C family protein n=1 Tax=Arabidopsis thaliana TaxID=3702 RepID=F4IG99_ARATH|nr:Protein phosphatase 2C family protein [Arabidopsis thaliana]AEC05891.1 Protein phosphatase 2C family protein [Arabidopsis thaliana]|eukprot:NP_001154495.1 Protein phosphatase 2C family protein [Arabidopsis thaliana]
MEDRFSTITNLHGDRKQAIFGVYVGHGGVKAAEFAAKNLDKNIVEEVVGKRHELEIAEALKFYFLIIVRLEMMNGKELKPREDMLIRFTLWRIQGSLVVPRGIGDAQLKKWVIAEPETKISRVEHDHEFLILASHGLWDKVSNQEAVDIARPFCLRTEKPLLLAACKKLVDLSASRGSFDDISVMLIPLRQFI